MYAMCYTCRAQFAKLDSGEEGSNKETYSGLDSEGLSFPYKCCKEEKYIEASPGEDGLTPYQTPLISPCISVKSNDSFVSSCSDLYGELDVADNNDLNADTGQEDLKTSFLSLAKETDESDTVAVELIEDNLINNMSRSIEGKENTAKNRELLSLFEGEMKRSLSEIDSDPSIWSPPEDNMEGSVVNNDDDKEDVEVTTREKPSSLSELCEEPSDSFMFKEQRWRTMEEARNGVFKSYISRLLTSACISLSANSGENWADIITSLAWEAALLVKGEAVGRRTMNPEGFVKVKCIATGSPSDSHLIKGMVFKKNTIHKRMQTKHKNPRLLLIEWKLGESSSGLSSFNSMEQQEKDNLKNVSDMINMSHPNVVLMEKSVPREMQESLIDKGITLVIDMKPHRLERIARCTGSEIFSSANSLLNQKLKQCDVFHFEKFVEEHNISKDGGKKPIKTLMFLEGCPRSSCCTVLLMGAHTDELKKVKHLMPSAVIVAYHLILETSFLVDERAIFSTIQPTEVDVFSKDKQLPNVGFGTLANANDYPVKAPFVENTSSCYIDIPISDGLLENFASEVSNCSLTSELDGSSSLSGLSPDMMSHENDADGINIHYHAFANRPKISHAPIGPTILQGQLLSLISTSLKKVIEDSLPLISSASLGSFSKYSGLKEKESGSQSAVDLPIFTSIEVHPSCEVEAKDKEDSLQLPNGEQAKSSSGVNGALSEQSKCDVNNENQVQLNNDIITVLDAQNILFLMSSRNLLKGTICEQIHISRIQYYRNFDVSLEQFLCNGLLNQMHRCSACGEPPGVHFYHYMHQDGKLEIRVKKLSKNLPGEAEGELWMWSRCLRCERSSRRVVMSTAARCLSFGKFLELSFLSHSISNKLSCCGQHRDYLWFYGLGPMVSIFRYSLVDIYNVSMPPSVLKFNNQNGQDWMKEEVNMVLKKASLLFTEVGMALQKKEHYNSLSHSSSNSSGPVKQLSEYKEMLKQEKSHFEAQIQKVHGEKEALGTNTHAILLLNRLLQELVLESYIWDRRLHFLQSSDTGILNNGNILEKDATAGGRTEERINTLEYGKEISDGTSTTPVDTMTDIVSDNDVITNSGYDKADIEINLSEVHTIGKGNSVNELQDSELHDENHTLEYDPNTALDSSVTGDNYSPTGSLTASTTEMLNDCVLGQDSSTELSRPSTPPHFENCQEETLASSDAVTNLDLGSVVGGISSKPGVKLLETDMIISQMLTSNLDGGEGWIWTPFSKICKTFWEDIRRGNPQKFEFITTYATEFLRLANRLIVEEGSRLYIPVGSDGNVVALYEDEPTSIIACALAILQNQHGSTEHLIEQRKEREHHNKAIYYPQYLASEGSAVLSNWSSTSSADSGISSVESVSSVDFPSLFDGSKVSDILSSAEALHPEIHLGTGKLSGKSKFSVVCLYEEQFRALRKKCCPDELDYISSLSRCKNWDAQGGKSGSLFIKTQDDRFIVKQIKKTEIDSFWKFAPDYFKYVEDSITSGSQTCLAKILGIYQVTIRQGKNGKEMKYDLMVMENVVYGRNITRLYDLKGTQHARYTKHTDGKGKVFLDGNFAEDMTASPLFISGKTKHNLQRAIWNDTCFLTSINVMDYSLLVGVDAEKKELVCGIIDYLRQYTWDKHLETWVKASLVVPKNETPTVISPKEYKKRFRKFMSSYFFSLPDNRSSDDSLSKEAVSSLLD